MTPSHTQVKIKNGLVIQVVDSHTCHKFSPTELLKCAAVCPEGSSDPVDQAMWSSLKVNRRDLFEDGQPLFHAVPDTFDPATTERRYSIAVVKGMAIAGQKRDLAVMRGDAESVLNAATISREERKLFIRHANMHHNRGRRNLAIAVAPVAEDGTIGEFMVEGFLALGLVTPGEIEKALEKNPTEWVQVHLWGTSLRIQHWLNLVLMILMTFTGYYIMDPFFGGTDYSGAEAPYLMGWIRFIHFFSAFTWIAVGLWRFALLFITKDRQSRWQALWPIYNSTDLKNMMSTIQYYLFLKKSCPLYLTHNALQQLAYTGIYVLCIVQMFTGLALYGMFDQSNWFWALLATPIHWLGIPMVRLIHAIIMFVIWAFVVIHVYLVFRAEAVNSHGNLAAMVGGSVWLRRGTDPVDAPRVG